MPPSIEAIGSGVDGRMTPPSIEAIGSGVDGLKQSSKAFSEQRRRNFYKDPEGREGAEKSRTLRETREERKEKQEERDNHNPDERAEESNSSVSEWCRKRSRLLGTESMA